MNKMTDEQIKEIDARVKKGEATEEDIEILTDYFKLFMDELG
jgi:hypothetical protein